MSSAGRMHAGRVLKRAMLGPPFLHARCVRALWVDVDACIHAHITWHLLSRFGLQETQLAGTAVY